MTFTLVVTPAANRDIDEAMYWYDAQDQVLGNRFISAVQARFGDILNDPLRLRQLTGSTIRVSLLNHWPYMIYFRVVNERVRVIAIIHTSRDPNYINSRLRMNS